MPDMYIMCMRVRQLTNDVHIKYKQKEALNSAVRGFSFVCILQKAYRSMWSVSL